ncbi:tetratricopeptide repeat-containing sulfotransferase family protein [Sphingomonas jatrophae]|uniref:Tetratricopeptide repeat-containing protein n=1 Tax=Sphingomonas jatrophae TaxID=1166337 RepID=A0A1I6M7I1_9SPHN|nr:sulfotransferase [Sphingomonas jatrophae]SFS11472.1 Tetratricopeptide repeat-containing protein [Sphingomonas jatrophae]
MTRQGNRGGAEDVQARIGRALAANDIAGAARLAEAALRQGLTGPMLLNLAAWAREEAGDYAGAHRLLARALAQAPGDVLISGAIGAVLRKEGRYDEALALLDRVVAAEPRHAAAWLERGYVLDALRERTAAAASYARALAVDPALAPAHGKLADAASQAGDGNTAQAHAARALALDPNEPSAVAALATLEIEARDGSAAEARLRALLAAGVKGEDRTRALTLLGDALDRQGRTQEAFASWSAAQGHFRRVHAGLLKPQPPAAPSHRQFIERIRQQVAAGPVVPAAPPVTAVPGAAARHVFLLGYPRSGTTLVENVLASASDVVALEERDTFAGIDGVLVANDGAMPDLDALPADMIERCRADYWARVRTLAGDVEGRCFVDMNPFNGIKLPIIARLFPDARILLMRRDPRDVVLSCFRINFTPSPAAWCFSDLVEAARHYDALMELTELCRERLPLAVHEVRYDQLVSAFEPTVRAFADFIGLPWTDDFRRFDRTAQSRGVRTASATQVRRGLYDGRGQWRRYATELAPVLPLLAPWVARFGFDA